MCSNSIQPLGLFLAIGCTFPIKNDIDTGIAIDPLSEYATIETREIPGCNTGNLYINVAVKNGSGIKLESNIQGTPAVLWAEIGNQCEDIDLEINQKSSCMVESLEIQQTPEPSVVYDFICDPEPTNWDLQSGQLRRQQITTVTDLPVGSYFMEVTFGVETAGGSRITATTDLDVFVEED